MDNEILGWIQENTGKWFTSARKTVFNSPKILDFRINKINISKQQVSMSFKDGTQNFLLDFWMFDRIIHRLDNIQGYVMIGARLQPPYPKGSLEEAVWTKPYPRDTSEKKVSPHICDILNHYGTVSYGYTKNLTTGKRVQGAKKEAS